MVNAKTRRYLERWFLAACGRAPAFAQFETATVLGTVRTPRLPPSPERGSRSGTSPRSDRPRPIGRERQLPVSNVKIGTYEVTGEMSGFAKAVARDVIVTVNARQRSTSPCRRAGVTEEITVSTGRRCSNRFE